MVTDSGREAAIFASIINPLLLINRRAATPFVSRQPRRRPSAAFSRWPKAVMCCKDCGSFSMKRARYRGQAETDTFITLGKHLKKCRRGNPPTNWNTDCNKPAHSIQSTHVTTGCASTLMANNRPTFPLAMVASGCRKRIPPASALPALPGPGNLDYQPTSSGSFDRKPLPIAGPSQQFEERSNVAFSGFWRTVHR